jgi:5-formyltetrahydrofolate cyclo-ligase
LLAYFEVALSYSAQIMEEGVIPVNSTDVPIDALVSSSGVIPISPAALERMK